MIQETTIFFKSSTYTKASSFVTFLNTFLHTDPHLTSRLEMHVHKLLHSIKKVASLDHVNWGLEIKYKRHWFSENTKEKKGQAEKYPKKSFSHIFYKFKPTLPYPSKCKLFFCFSEDIIHQIINIIPAQNDQIIKRYLADWKDDVTRRHNRCLLTGRRPYAHNKIIQAELQKLFTKRSLVHCKYK